MMNNKVSSWTGHFTHFYHYIIPIIYSVLFVFSLQFVQLFIFIQFFKPFNRMFCTFLQSPSPSEIRARVGSQTITSLDYHEPNHTQSSSSSNSQGETANSDTGTSPESSRVPMAWRYRQAHAETVESTTAFRGGIPPYQTLQTATTNGQPNPRRNYFGTATAIRSIDLYSHGQRGHTLSSKIPKIKITHKRHVQDGFQTLPVSGIRRAQTLPPVPQLSTSFYRLPKPVIPPSVSQFTVPLSPTPRSTRDESQSTVGSQFWPGIEPGLADYATNEMRHHSFMQTDNGACTPAWRAPGFYPVNLLPPPAQFSSSPMMQGGGGGSPVAVSVPGGGYNHGGAAGEEGKRNCGDVCCSGSFIVLWLIVAVIALGVIVGMAVIFGRRNVLNWKENFFCHANKWLGCFSNSCNFAPSFHCFLKLKLETNAHSRLKLLRRNSR